MTNNLPQLIFEQFLEIVERSSKNACFEFDECDFNFRVRDLVNHRIMNVVYIVEDKCGRRHDVFATIDITSICVEDLTSCKWVAYLEKIAREFINDICPSKLVIIKDEPRKCRPQPPRWEPFPCGIVTTVIRKRKPIVTVPECEVIIEKECECVPICKRVPCTPKQQIVIKYDNELIPHQCGDFTMLEESPNKHDYKVYKGTQDFNDHIWKKCCTGKAKKCCGN